MIYNTTITDVAEVGYLKHPGGSVKISIMLDSQLKKFEKKAILKIIDLLDHTTLSDNINITKFSDRNIILFDNDKSFLNNVLLTIGTIFNTISILKDKIQFISVQLGDEILSGNYKEIIKDDIDFTIDMSNELYKDIINIRAKLEKKYANRD